MIDITSPVAAPDRKLKETDLLTNDRGTGGRSPWRDAIDKWRKIHKSWKELRQQKNYQMNGDFMRRMDREAYAAKKHAEGKAVRSYEHRHLAPLPGEWEEDFIRRRNREYQKVRYNERVEAEGRTVRAYNDLSDMSDEEKAAYKREQNARNKREARRRAKEATSSVPSSNTTPHTFRV